MSQVKVGVIGVGRMGQNHCRVYSGLRRVNFVGVYDTNFTTAEQVAQRYEIKAFRSVDDLLDEVEAVSITTPTPAHFELARHCMDRRKHILIEKPLCETLEQAEIIAGAADACDLVVQVGHIERFNPTYTELKNVLETLPPLTINFRRLSPFQGSNTDVDVILDLMTHDLDLVLDLVQCQPERIHASGLKLFTDHFDHSVVQLTFQCGPIVTLTASRITEQKIRSIEVTTPSAYLEADLLNKMILVHRRATGKYLSQNHANVKYHQESFIERILVPTIEPLLNEVQHFVGCVMEHQKPIVTARDGYKALRLALEIRDQSRFCETAPEPQFALA